MGYTKQEIKHLCKGKTPEQKKAIKYLCGGGCLSSGMSDDAYSAMVDGKAHSTDFKQRALNKLGLELEQVSILDPVKLEGYVHRDKNLIVKRRKDYKYVTSKYRITCLFFSETQVYIYQYVFSMIDESVSEKTYEYFYKDIVNFKDMSDTEDFEVNIGQSCSGKPKTERKIVDYDEFEIVVPGDKVSCSMESNDVTSRAIQAMKALLRDKKNQ